MSCELTSNLIDNDINGEKSIYCRYVSISLQEDRENDLNRILALSTCLPLSNPSEAERKPLKMTARMTEENFVRVKYRKAAIGANPIGDEFFLAWSGLREYLSC